MLISRKAKSKDQKVFTEIIHTALKTTSTSNYAYCFDSDGIIFIIYNSATCVICNQRDLFIGSLSTEQVSMTTCEGDSAKQQYLGTMRLILTDDSNTNHSYDIQNCMYDPGSPVNIVRVPMVSELFNDAATGHDAVAEDNGTKILSSSRRSYFPLYHVKHHRHFTHPNNRIPELCLYQGTGYFQHSALGLKVFTTIK